MNPDSRGVRPRVALLEPQRVFGHALARALSADFDVICCVSEVEQLRGAEQVDLAVIDIDAVDMPADDVLQTAQVLLDGALLCLLGLDPPGDHLINETRVYAAKATSADEFVNFVRAMTLPARPPGGST